MIGKAIAAVLVSLGGLLGAAALVAALIGALNPFNGIGGTDTPGAPEGSGEAPSEQAIADIPANYIALYQDAAQVCPGLHWSILAGIGKVESNHGRSNLPGVHSGQNQAGAKGPMQFLQSTFNAVVARHPLTGRDGLFPPSPYDPSDAIHAAAYLLCDNGARNGEDIYTAIWNYNHDSSYVTRVLEIAHQYATTPNQPGTDGAPPPAQPSPAGPAPLPQKGYLGATRPASTLQARAASRATGAVIVCLLGFAASGPVPMSSVRAPTAHGDVWPHHQVSAVMLSPLARPYAYTLGLSSRSRRVRRLWFRARRSVHRHPITSPQRASASAPSQPGAGSGAGCCAAALTPARAAHRACHRPRRADAAPGDGHDFTDRSRGRVNFAEPARTGLVWFYGGRL